MIRLVFRITLFSLLFAAGFGARFAYPVHSMQASGISPAQSLIEIVEPTRENTYTTSQPEVTISAHVNTASEITGVLWKNNRNGKNGEAQEHQESATFSVPLEPGKNVITSTAINHRGKRDRDYLTVYRKNPPSPLPPPTPIRSPLPKPPDPSPSPLPSSAVKPSPSPKSFPASPSPIPLPRIPVRYNVSLLPPSPPASAPLPTTRGLAGLSASSTATTSRESMQPTNYPFHPAFFVMTALLTIGASTYGMYHFLPQSSLPNWFRAKRYRS